MSSILNGSNNGSRSIHSGGHSGEAAKTSNAKAPYLSSHHSKGHEEKTEDNQMRTRKFNSVSPSYKSPEGKKVPSKRQSGTKDHPSQPVIKVDASPSPLKQGKSKSSHHQKRHSASSSTERNLFLSEPSIQFRRKSSPSIHPNVATEEAPLTSSTSPCSKKTKSRRKKSTEDPNETLLTVNKMELFGRRRLSSPPSLLQDQQFQFLEGMMTQSGGGNKHGVSGGGESNSSSRGSSGHGSLQQLAISGLNLSSTDMRNNTIRSGHQDIGTLFAPNNITYQDPISINLVNAPDNSTTQCDCGHINCPMCNLMMNLELTDPDLLK